ncbi:MAG: O-antigen ligase family protein [Rhodothermales bacterium]
MLINDTMPLRPAMAGEMTRAIDPAQGDEVRLLVPEALVMTGVIALLYVAPVAAYLVFAGIAGYALLGARQTIQALTMLFLVSNLNPALFHLPPSVASLRWLVLFGAFGRVLWDGVLGRERWPAHLLFALGVYAASVAVLALSTSRIPVISFFKLVAFVLGTVTVLTSHYRTADHKAYWLSWYTTFFLCIIAASLLVFRFPAAFFGSGGGFRGILVHPQTLGPITAPMTAWMIGRYLFHETRTPIVLVSIVLGLLTIYFSEARTALAMLAGSIGLAMILSVVRRWNTPKRRVRRKASFIPLVLGVLFAGMLVMKWDGVVNRATMFFLKSDESSIYEEAESFHVRASMVQQQWENFLAHPVSGIGFGIPSTTDAWVRVQTGFLGIPTSFTTEKGFLPSAVLEETGLIGAILVLAFGFSLLRHLFRNNDYAVTAVMLSCLLVNIGEMAFFSFGAYGLYFWLLIAFSYSVIARRS